jgi:hypothetical protein
VPSFAKDSPVARVTMCYLMSVMERDRPVAGRHYNSSAAYLRPESATCSLDGAHKGI